MVIILQSIWQRLMLSEHKLIAVSQDGIALLNIVVIIILLTGINFFANRLRRKIKSNQLPQLLLRRNLVGLLVLASVQTLNLFNHLVLGHSSSVLEFATTIILASIIIQTLGVCSQKLLCNQRYARKLNKVLAAVIWLLTFLIVTDSDNDIITFLDNINFNLGKINISLWDLVHGLTTIIIAFIAAVLVNQYCEKKINQVRQMDSNLQQILVRSCKIISFVLAFIIALPIIGVDITALSVMGGAIGVGIGFGLQKITSNFLSGFIILLDRSIKVGDRLVLDNQSGIISKITTRYVVMERFDGTEVLIPNETFITTAIQNQSYSTTELRSEITIQLGAANQLLSALDRMKQIVQATPNTIPHKATVVITKILENGIGVEAKAYFWVKEPSKITEASNYIYAQLIESFNRKELLPPQSSQHVVLVNT